MEELAELIQAISKFLRKNEKENLLEEIADVEIILEQIKMCYLIKEDLKIIEAIKESKLERLNKRYIEALNKVIKVENEQNTERQDTV